MYHIHGWSFKVDQRCACLPSAWKKHICIFDSWLRSTWLSNSHLYICRHTSTRASVWSWQTGHSPTPMCVPQQVPCEERHSNIRLKLIISLMLHKLYYEAAGVLTPWRFYLPNLVLVSVPVIAVLHAFINFAERHNVTSASPPSSVTTGLRKMVVESIGINVYSF